MSAAPTSTRGERTREKILACAEQLFAEQGIDRVTLRQIARAADQSNVSAVQYHFGSKLALLEAILSRHQRAIDERRRERLDQQELAGSMHDLRGLMRTLVEPLAAELDDPSGCAYLRIQAQQLRRSETMQPATRLMTMRISQALWSRAEERDPLADHFSVLLLFSALADRAREEAAGGADASDRERYIEGLTRALLGVFQGLGEPTASRSRS